MTTRLKLDKSFVIDDNFAVGGQWEGWPAEGGISQIHGGPTISRPEPHTGTDIYSYDGKIGQPMYFPLEGYARPQRWGTYGLWYTVELQPDEVYGQLYMCMAHLADLAVPEARYVQQGEYAGPMGSTGWSSGPHVHFCFDRYQNISGDYRNGVDPFEFIRRAQEEEEIEMLPEYQRWLLATSVGDVHYRQAIYRKLDRYRSATQPVGFFHKQNTNDGVVQPIDGRDDLNDVNAMADRIQTLAYHVDPKVAQEAYAAAIA